MRRFRFHLGSLVILILILGVGFAALRESNETWDSLTLSITLGVLLISILLAVHRTESRRAFWMGFAVFGWIYLGLSLIPPIESRLITTKALAFLDSMVPGRSSGFMTLRFTATTPSIPSNQVQAVAFSPQGNQLATSSPGQVRIWDVATGRVLGGWNGATENFIRIGHSLFALLAGWIGGLISRRLYRTSRVPETSTAVDVEGTSS